MYKNIEIIAEVKTHSPFDYRAEKTWDELFDIAKEIGDIVSIHTDPRWGGSLELIKKARLLTTKPILAKGLHTDDNQIQNAIEAGADWVLVVGRLPMVHAEKCFIEPLTLKELRNFSSALKVVWNSRDLSTGEQKQETFEEARAIYKGW